MRRMPRAAANGIELEYETFGDARAPALLLIMGFGSQMIVWPEEFCRRLADRDLFVIRFDNRDVGLSTKPTAAYSLDDMADDAAGLLAALGRADAHVLGISMGGYIAQLVALRHPARLRTLCLMMTSTGARNVGQAAPDVIAMLMRPQPSTRAEYIEHRLAITRRLASPGYPFDEPRQRALIGAGWDRCFFPLGVQRQLGAVMMAGDRTAALGTLSVPTLILHGDADPIVHNSGGEALARAIPAAELHILPGLGHDLPEPLWTSLADLVAAHAHVDTRRRAGIGS
jgi:pimeloyl-ACP methyl ester carboxylesterase